MHQSQDRTNRARRLRAQMTGAEVSLWAMLRGRALDGLKFRRQAPVAGYVVDFLCPELRLIVELDGGVHDLRTAEDAARDARLRVAGFTVVRIRNGDFGRNPAVVFEAIRRHRARVGHPPHPSGCAAHLLPLGEKGVRT